MTLGEIAFLWGGQWQRRTQLRVSCQCSQKLREGVPQTHKEHWAGSYSIHHSREHKPPPMFAIPSYTDKVESSVAYFSSTTYYVILNQ